MRSPIPPGAYPCIVSSDGWAVFWQGVSDCTRRPWMIEWYPEIITHAVVRDAIYGGE